MAITQNTYTGNGSTVLYSFAFPYLNTADVKVSINGTITTAYTFANATTIQFNTAPANGAAIRIYRETNDASLQAVLSPGSSIRASDLNDNFDQLIYLGQEANTEADSATATANTALTNSATAISTANTASTNASAAVSTANTASANASAAVTTANTASTNASAAVSTANTASTNATTALNTANAATTTANNAVTSANNAVSTANTALTNANAAVSTANTASTNATNAVNTANTANSNANTAVTTANNAVTTANSAVNTANSAVSTANSAVTTANAAAAAVANAVLYTTVANVAAIPGSPSNNDAVEVTDSTGIESFTPLSGLPGGFVGSSGLAVRLIYQSVGSTWTWIQYFPNDPEARYLKFSGGTLTGQLRGDDSASASTPGFAFDGDANTGMGRPGADELALITGGSARLTIDPAGAVSIPGTLGVTGAITGSLTGSASNNVLKAGDTMTGALGVTAGTAGAPSVFISGDTNTGLYSPGADQVAISTGGSGRLFVDASGNVGVGATPTERFQVAVSNNANVAIKISNSGTSGYIQQNATSGNGAIEVGSNAAYPLVLSTNATERLRITSAGLVGVGTSSPGYRLHVEDNSTGIQQRISSSSTSGTTLSFVNTAANGRNYRIGSNFVTGNGEFALYDDTASASRIFVNSSGSVGIGTSSPSTLLHIQSTDPAFRFKRSDAGTDAYGELTTDTSGLVTMKCDPANAAAGSGFRITVDNSEALRVDSSGRVGIGNTPEHPLDVSGTIRVKGTTDATLFIDSASGSKGFVYWRERTVGDRGILGFANGSGDLVYRSGAYDFSSGTERFRCDSSGRLLVGTSSFSGNARAVFQGHSAGANQPGLIWIRRDEALSGSVSGADLGQISFGDNTGEYAQILAEADGSVSTNDYPGRLVFSVTRDGQASPTESLRISNDGSISSVVPGGSTLYPRFGCRAWVNFNGTSTVAIRGNGNVSSITDNGTGDYTVNFTTAMPDANYAIAASHEQVNGTSWGTVGPTGSGNATSSCRINVPNAGGSGTDRTYIFVAIFR